MRPLEGVVGWKDRVWGRQPTTSGRLNRSRWLPLQCFPYFRRLASAAVLALVHFVGLMERASCERRLLVRRSIAQRGKCMKAAVEKSVAASGLCESLPLPWSLRSRPTTGNKEGTLNSPCLQLSLRLTLAAVVPQIRADDSRRYPE